ncbi:MAG: prolyl oligopeptidase family serine peptidase, partial [Pirellulaceae bacterium]|nr:prolyl oligopeptidase family serine peptidase [Pirellulaceae bacterium]
ERGSRKVFRDRVIPHWSADGNRFWYRNDLDNNQREFIVVDAVAGSRQPAFDHALVAQTIGNGATAERLPIDELAFVENSPALVLMGAGKRWKWDPASQKLTPADQLPATEQAATDKAAAIDDGAIPARTGAETELTFNNRMQRTVEIFWLNGDGGRQSYGKIEPGALRHQHTFGGHRWLVVTDQGETLGEVIANDTPTEITLDGQKLQAARSPRRRNGNRNNGDAANTSNKSPDGRWVATIKEHNVVVRATDSEEQLTLSRDGSEGLAYERLSWSPDSRTLVALRKEAGDQLEVHLVRSSPPGGGRAVLESRPYALPGDKFSKYEPNLFRLETADASSTPTSVSWKHIKPTVDRFEHEWATPRIRWNSDSQSFTYEQTDRGHQRFRVIEVNVVDGQVRHLIDEKSETFIWTAHTENNDLAPIHWLKETPELIHVTEQSGHRHLVLVDTQSGQAKHAITSGSWIVRGIERIDEEQRQVWFRASGCFEQDPYFIHYGRVNFDGTGLVWLTEGNGNHTLQYSPDRRFAIDSYSRVDAAPTTELRRVQDGRLVCLLEKADTQALQESGWSAPEVFVAKGRDSQTDIWGCICRPKNFEPGKRYPVIEDIYAGPHGAFVPKSFSPSQRYDALTSLGFIVVKIDGMGTAHRSKAFHDVCWHNLKDGGFKDRILWMQAAGAKYPEMDLTRVGIYGTSAGGQNAAAAVLFHPEFYKVAVAACGCHDNRMDKASWNEQWMGYPVGPHYSECSNIDNAHRLEGKLLLIVGEMDTNVPPESTMRLADALIRADKDFDLLVVPNAGHGNGGAYGVRRMHNFFVKHLLTN